MEAVATITTSSTANLARNSMKISAWADVSENYEMRGLRNLNIQATKIVNIKYEN